MMKKLLCLMTAVIAICSVSAQKPNPADDNRNIRIPVVFHVLQTIMEQRLVDSLIIHELNDLNADFRSMNDQSVLAPDFKDLVGNPKLEFYLLDTVFSPVHPKGINHVSESQHRQSLLIRPIHCVNVFIAVQGNASGILSDRINLNIHDIGRHTHVLTHEMGHWLGLYHIWGKVGSCNRFRAIFSNHDDGIDDTPEQYKCTDLSFSTECPPPGKKIYYKGHKVMYNNFMDYSGCRCMFTIGQAIQMRNNIIEHKPALFSPQQQPLEVP